MQRSDLAGRHLTEYTVEFLQNGGARNSEIARDLEVARNIKVKACYVSKDASSETAEALDNTLPDGNTIIRLRDSRFSVPEAILAPSM